jgi:pimeloyl-ACP methyl ester carboxylesterase
LRWTCFGRSDKPPITYRIAGFVEVLEGFLYALGIERASLLGHSLGGWIIAAFALQHPDLVDRLVLNDSAGLDAGAIRPPVDLHISTHAHMRAMLESMFFDKRMVTNELVDLSYSQHLERGDGATIDSILQTFRVPDEKLDRKISGLTVPTLLLWGEQDALTPLSLAQNFPVSSAAPGSTSSPNVDIFRAWKNPRNSRAGCCISCNRNHHGTHVFMLDMISPSVYAGIIGD